MSTFNDKQILNAILNPNTPILQEEVNKCQNIKPEYDLSEAIDEAKKLEVEGIKSAEANDLKCSIEYFNEAVEKAPNWASAYNNRAQALRLTGDVDGASENLIENLKEQHRKEKKDLQSKVQSLKKSVPKGDRKKKKEVDAEIEKLEKDFEDKCQLEMKNLETSLLNKNVKDVEETSNESNEQKNKVTKSKKRREKKEKENERLQNIVAQEEIDNKKGPAFLELKKIKEKLEKKALRIKEVNSDGNCMYYALSDQISDRLSVTKSYKELREMAGDFMLKNPSEFQPYLCDESTGESLNNEQYRVYCRKVKETLAWGGQLELKALSDALKVAIEVVQAEGADILIGGCDTTNTEKLVITYHRRMFGSGEHYNSTCQKTLNDEEND